MSAFNSSWCRNVQNKITVEVLAPRMLALCVVLALGVLPGSEASAGNTWASKPRWAAANSGNQSIQRAPADAPYSERSREFTPMSPGSNNLALDVGQVFLMGDLSDDYQDNIGVQLHYTYGVSDLFGFDASAGFSTHSNGGQEGKDLFMGSFLAGLRTNLAWYDRVVPYAVFGL